MKINLFYLTDEFLNTIKVDVGLNKPVYSIKAINEDGSIIRDYLPGINSGLKWSVNEQEYFIDNKGHYLFGYPSVDMKYIIAIYGQEDTNYPAPKNALIFNWDGTVHMQMKVPELISDIYKERKPFMKNQPAFLTWFSHVSWKKDKNDKVVISIRISFDKEWYEERLLIPQTGEFGECLASGRF